MRHDFHPVSLCCALAFALPAIGPQVATAGFDVNAYWNAQIPTDVGRTELASFSGWDDDLIRNSGQTFSDVFGDGSGVDITVRASGTYNAGFSPGVATTYSPTWSQIGTSANSEWNQLTFQLNTDLVHRDFESRGAKGFRSGELFLHTTTLGSNESLRFTSLSGSDVRFSQQGSSVSPQPIGNGTSVVEIKSGFAGRSGRFLFSKPSSFSVTHATTANSGYKLYRLGRIADNPDRPVPVDSMGMPKAVFPSEGIPEFAVLSGWDDALIRSTGQRFSDVFLDGKLDVVVSSQGTFSASRPTGSDNRRQTFVRASNEWNSLIFRLEPRGGGSDIGGKMFLDSQPLYDQHQLVRVASLDGTPLRYTEQVAGAVVEQHRLSDHSLSVTGTGNGRAAANGTFWFDASTFQLTYAAEDGPGYQFFQLGRKISPLDPCTSRLVQYFARFGEPDFVCADLDEAVNGSSTVSVPEPSGATMIWFGLLLLVRLKMKDRRRDCGGFGE